MALMMEVVSTCERSVSFYEITRLNISEDIHLHEDVFQHALHSVSVRCFGNPRLCAVFDAETSKEDDIITKLLAIGETGVGCHTSSITRCQQI
jgi:predicted protein tyrosine phosphatase